MNKIQKALKKFSLILRGRIDLAQKRKKIRNTRLSSLDGRSKAEKSQHGQDEWVVNFYKSKPDCGIFVEFGAHDGKTNSNTYRLEKEFGWNGLLIEPIPGMYSLLSKSRSCQCMHACISNKSGTVLFMEVTGPASQLSGIADEFPPSHLKRIDMAIEKQGGSKIVHEIRALTLSQALDEQGLNRVDFLSIDTEGSEYEILRAFPFEKYNIGVIAVENSYHGDYLIELMELNGYELVDILGCDEIYVNRRLVN